MAINLGNEVMQLVNGESLGIKQISLNEAAQWLIKCGVAEKWQPAAYWRG